MRTPEATLPPRLRRRLERWLDRWGTPSLASTLRVEYSPRLRRAFGRCYQQKRLIRLTPSLRDSQSSLLAEILCHEAAHAAVYALHGAAAKPHGEEWEEMMREAGFEPRVRIPVVVRNQGTASAAPRVRYLHHCPVCDRSRHASKPMHQWRCRTCVDGKRHGRLLIRREDAGRPVQRRAASPARKETRRSAAGTATAARRKSTARTRQQRT